jgi:hypothetical protein
MIFPPRTLLSVMTYESMVRTSGPSTVSRIVEIIRALREFVALRAADASEEGVCKRASSRVGHRAELHAEAKRSTCEPDVPRDDATCHRD